MSQSNPGIIDPSTTSGAELADILSNAFDAEITSHSGASRPTYAKAGTLWLDTANASAWALKLYDGTDDNILWTLDPTTGTLSITGLADPADDGDAATKAYVDRRRIAFAANKTANQAVANGTTLVTWGETVDPSGSFASNRFTAPIAGLYYFHAHLTFAGGTIGGEAGVQIRRNGVNAISPITSRSGAFNATPSGGVVLDLAAGNYVEVYAELVSAGGTVELALGRCGFSGFFIG